MGAGIALGNVWILALVYPAVRIMNLHVIAKEEAFLRQAFGEDYVSYLATTRRWMVCGDQPLRTNSIRRSV